MSDDLDRRSKDSQSFHIISGQSLDWKALWIDHLHLPKEKDA